MERNKRRREAEVDSYAWEGEMDRPWERIEEDERGHLKALHHLVPRARRVQDAVHVVRRGIIRYLCVVLDLSASANLKDMAPTRLAMINDTVAEFLSDLFDQNPLSQVSLVATRDEAAETICRLTGNLQQLQDALENALEGAEGKGYPSVENSLRRCLPELAEAPPYTSKEILLVYCSTSTCDPGNIYGIIARCVEQNVRCSVIGLGGELQILRKLVADTGGTYTVPLHELHFRELLLLHCTPRAITAGQDGQLPPSHLITMGFPSRVTEESPCVCHQEERQMTTAGYSCPRCAAKHCSLPVVCNVCGLMLVSAPHLARSYHHLFPLNDFQPLPRDQGNTKPCFACNRSEAGEVECVLCKGAFCKACDEFIHRTLHNCPGCV